MHWLKLLYFFEHFLKFLIDLFAKQLNDVILKIGFAGHLRMWVRAVWIEGKREEEGVISEVWIENKTVRWPDGINVLRARTEQRKSTEKWHKFPLVKVKFRSG